MTAGKIYALLDGRFNVSDRRHPRGRPARPAAPRHPQLRGRGRGHHARGDRPLDPRRRPAAERRVARSATRHEPSAHDRTLHRAAARATAPTRPAGTPGRAEAGTRPAFLPSSIDPTVFDEGFLRQLERLLLLMKRPVRGGLKGGRRSVKRGQSVEFADFRDYSLGDDLRQLDWNVLARLEKLFIKLYVEEEDVTIHFLLDASASMAAGPPGEAPVREARRGRARLHRAGVGGPRRGHGARRAGRAGGRSRCAAPGASSGCSPALSAIAAGRRPDGPRRRRAPRRRAAHAAAA